MKHLIKVAPLAFALVSHFVTTAAPAATGNNSVLVIQGYQLLSRGAVGPAIDTLSRAVRQVPGDASARRYLACALLQKGLAAEAVTQLKAVLLIEPGQASDLVMLGDACFYAGKLNDAVAAYKEALRVDPSCGQALAGLAQTCFNMGNLGRAAEICRQGLALTSDSQARQKLTALAGKISARNSVALSTADHQRDGGAR
ncbi:MAG TPA: tetratricopeptide repeat protein [Candidatus Obscuribacterales bacterium]